MTYSLDLGSAFTVSSANLNITRPDGVVNNAAVTVTPGGSANPQLLAAMYTPVIGGLHKGIWQPTVSSVQLSYPFQFWVVWTAVYDNIRTLLGLTPTSLPDAKIDFEFFNVYTWIKTFATINDYYTLNTSYQAGIDQGMSLLVASVLRPYIGGKRPTGEIILYKKGTTTTQFSTSGAKAGYPLEQQWWERGMSILESLIPEIAGAAAMDRSGDEIMTRGDYAFGNLHPKGEWVVGSMQGYDGYRNGPWSPDGNQEDTWGW